MGRGVRELMARLAGEMGERATLRVETLGGGDECVELIPRNPAAAKIAIEHNPDADDVEEERWVTVPTKPHPTNRPISPDWSRMCEPSSPGASRSSRAAGGTGWRSTSRTEPPPQYGTQPRPRLPARPRMAATRQGHPVRAVHLIRHPARMHARPCRAVRRSRSGRPTSRPGEGQSAQRPVAAADVWVWHRSGDQLTTRRQKLTGRLSATSASGRWAGTRTLLIRGDREGDPSTQPGDRPHHQVPSAHQAR